MLRIHQSVSAAQAKQYYTQSLGRGDYYTRNGEQPGHWYGKGAERLGLSGEIGKDDFFALLENTHPSTGERLSVRDIGDKRRPGWDLVFSPPKGVSVLRHFGDERIAKAMTESVHETLRELEAEAIKTRERRGGKNSTVATGNLIASLFFHDTTRELSDGHPDPHDHIHAYIHNITWAPHESRWQAAELFDVHIDRPYYEAAFEARLAQKLNALGYPIERRADGWDIAGIPKQVIDTFSRRTAEIEATAKRLGIQDAHEKAELGAKTRRKKGTPQPTEVLKTYWQNKLSSEDHKTLTGLIDHARSGTVKAAANVSPTQSLTHAIDHVFDRESTVAMRKIQTEALRYGVGSVSPEQVRSQLDQQPLLTALVGNRKIATTKEVLTEEQQMLHFARTGRGACDPLGGFGKHAFQRTFLNSSQKQAVTELLASFDRVQILRGLAGVGKSTALGEVRDGIEAQGRQVLAVAPSTGAVQVLAKDGFRAETVAMLLTDPWLQDELRGGVLLVDEAGLVGTRTMARLFAVADKQHARVILSGDVGQHRSVERGMALKLLEERSGIKPAGLTHIMRQIGKLKDAVTALAQGRGEEGFQQLDALGSIHEIEDGVSRYQQLAKEYADTLAQGREVLAIAPTHAEGAKVTTAIRDELQQRGLIAPGEQIVSRLVSADLTEAQRRDPVQYQTGMVVQFVQNATGGWKRGERVTVSGHTATGVTVMTRQGEHKQLPLNQAAKFQLYRATALPVSQGDRVRITLGGATVAKKRLVNGSVHTITGFTATGDLRLENGWTLPKDYGHLASGWTVTSHASQGKTVKGRVFIAQSAESLPASNLEQFYVSVSRAKGSAEAVAVFTDNKIALRQAVSRSQRPLSATELQEHAEAASTHKQVMNTFMTRLRRWKYLATLYTKMGWERMQHQIPTRNQSPEIQRGLNYGR
jgi:conjugative relaxase-like TrwC/TraI family protein